jgi:hypothetical protein
MNLKELNKSTEEDCKNAISDDLETPNFQKFPRFAPWWRLVEVGPPKGVVIIYGEGGLVNGENKD